MLHLLNSYDCRHEGRAAVDRLLAAKGRQERPERRKLPGTQQASVASLASLHVQRSPTQTPRAVAVAAVAVEPLGSLQSWQVDSSGTQLTRITAVWWCVSPDAGDAV